MVFQSCVIKYGAVRGIRTLVGRPTGLAIRRNGQAMRSPQQHGHLRCQHQIIGVRFVVIKRRMRRGHLPFHHRHPTFHLQPSSV